MCRAWNMWIWVHRASGPTHAKPSNSCFLDRALLDVQVGIVLSWTRLVTSIGHELETRAISLSRVFPKKDALWVMLMMIMILGVSVGHECCGGTSWRRDGCHHDCDGIIPGSVLLLERNCRFQNGKRIVFALPGVQNCNSCRDPNTWKVREKLRNVSFWYTNLRRTETERNDMFTCFNKSNKLVARSKQCERVQYRPLANLRIKSTSLRWVQALRTAIENGVCGMFREHSARRPVAGASQYGLQTAGSSQLRVSGTCVAGFRAASL